MVFAVDVIVSSENARALQVDGAAREELLPYVCTLVLR